MGDYYTEPEVLPIQFSNRPLDDPGSIAEGTLGQCSPYYLGTNFDGNPELIVKCGKRLYEVYDTCQCHELRTDCGGYFGAHRNHIAIGDFTGDGIADIINVSEDGNSLLLFQGCRLNDMLCFASGQALYYEDGTRINPSAWHYYTKHLSCGNYFGSGQPDLLLSTCSEFRFWRIWAELLSLLSENRKICYRNQRR